MIPSIHPPNPARTHLTWPFLHFMMFYTIQTKYFLKPHGIHYALTHCIDHIPITRTDPSDPPNPPRTQPTWPFLHCMTFCSIQTIYFLKPHPLPHYIDHFPITRADPSEPPLHGIAWPSESRTVVQRLVWMAVIVAVCNCKQTYIKTRFTYFPIIWKSIFCETPRLRIKCSTLLCLISKTFGVIVLQRRRRGNIKGDNRLLLLFLSSYKKYLKYVYIVLKHLIELSKAYIITRIE